MVQKWVQIPLWNYKDMKGLIMTDTILLLSDIDQIRERPGTFIGDNGECGLATIIREIIDNAIDEYPNYPDKTKPVTVTLKADDSIVVRDHGRGISPYESKANPGEIEERLVYTRMGSGGKFQANREQNANRFSGGLNGIGGCATNAMSDFLDITIYKDGYIFHDRFEDGEPVVKLKNGKLPKVKQKTPETGTQVHFKPSNKPKRLTTTKVNEDMLKQLLEQRAYLNKGLTLELINEKEGETYTFHAPNGLLDYINKITADTKNLTKPFLVSGYKSEEVDGFEVHMQADIALVFSDDKTYSLEASTNGIRNKLGGTHVKGFEDGLVRLMKHYYAEFSSDLNTKYRKQIDLIKKILNVDDVSKLFQKKTLMQRTHVIIDFKHNNPMLSPQTKDELNNKEVVPMVSDVFYDKARLHLDKNITAVHKLLDQLIKELYEKAKELDKNTTISKKDAKIALSTKLAQARGKDPKKLELILVEGDSAAGTLKANRDADFQAILPLRGKVLNVNKATLAKALENQEITTIFSVLGISFGAKYDPKQLKYHKIIIGTDQDVDGKHIRTLLITLFMKYAPGVVLGGHLYFLDTPLFVNYGRNKIHYTYSEDEQLEYLSRNKPKYVERNKGLGELSADQVNETILNPQTRKLTQLRVDDPDVLASLIDDLMGDNTAKRKQLFFDK